MRIYHAHCRARMCTEHLLLAHARERDLGGDAEFYLGLAERDLTELAELLGFRLVRHVDDEAGERIVAGTVGRKG